MVAASLFAFDQRATFRGGGVRKFRLTHKSRSESHLGIACPMANEGDSAVPFVKLVLERCVGFRQTTFFAVLDNANRDNSLELLRSYAAAELRLRVVWAPENRCVVDAYLRGYHEALAAGCDWILEIDAGFSHQPEDLPKFFDAMTGGYDCIFGSRFMKGSRLTGENPKRYIVSRGGTLLSNLLLGTRQTDMTSGFEFFSRAALEHVLKCGIRSRAHFFQTETKTFCRNLKWIEVPIHYSSPSPRLKAAAVSEAFRQLWQLRQRVGSRAV
jgi:dolichol-phosphate mannosyltransferase